MVGLGGPFAFHHFGVNVIVCTYVDHVEFGMLIYGRIRVANSLEWKKVVVCYMLHKFFVLGVTLNAAKEVLLFRYGSMLLPYRVILAL